MPGRRTAWWLSFLCGAPLACDTTTELELQTRTLRDANIDQPYSLKLEVVGGTPPYRFAVASGALPDGLQLTSEGGQIVGVPTTPGDHAFVARVSDAGQASTEAALVLHVVPHVLEVVTTELPDAKEGAAYAFQIEARGGLPPYAFSLTEGTLLEGLQVYPDGRLAGTPRSFGSRPFTVTVEDTRGRRASRSLRLDVLSLRPMIVRRALPRARLGLPYPEHTRLEVSGGEAPHTWRLANGALPSGMSLAPDGLVSGTPDERGVFEFAAQVVDADGLEDEASFAVAVVPPLQIDSLGLARIRPGQPLAFQLEASGGLPPYRWTSAPGSGPLPAGLNLSSAGLISGTTSALGPYSFTVVVEDSEPSPERVEARLEGEVGDRLVYRSRPELPFPPTCTGTTVSYQSAWLEVQDSVQVLDLDVELDVSYADSTEPFEGQFVRLQLLLIGPDGTRVALCGGGAGLAETPGCNVLFPGRDRITTRFDAPTLSEQPLAAFVGTNPRGPWRLAAVVTHPTRSFRGECQQRGLIHSFGLHILDDPSPEDYVQLGGFRRINLFFEPTLRVFGGGLPEWDLFLTATAYSTGPNRVREAGRGDDIPLADDFSFTASGCDALGVQVTADGHVRAGASTGQCRVAASASGYSASTRIVVLPPDFHRLSRAF